MLMEDLPLDNAALKETIGNGKVEFCLHNPRSKSGMQTWELKVLNSDGTRKIVIVRDYGFEVKREQVKIKPFKTREERNKEIYRLYHEEGLSQVFLGNLFNISQPSISLIVNGKSKQ